MVRIRTHATANRGKLWSTYEEALMMQMVDIQDKTYEQVAKKLQRTPIGVTVRYDQYKRAKKREANQKMKRLKRLKEIESFEQTQQQQNTENETRVYVGPITRTKAKKAKRIQEERLGYNTNILPPVIVPQLTTIQHGGLW